MGYKLELLTHDCLGAHKDKDGENVPKFKSVEVVLVHCNLVKNDYQHISKV